MKKNSEQTQSLDKLPRISLSGHAGFKHRLVNVDAVSVLTRCALKTALFQSVTFIVCFFF